MSHIVVFHSALGLRPAVRQFAAALEEAGHEVTVPDFYVGRVFEDEATGVAHRDEIGVRTLMNRAAAALEDVPDDAALAGFSLGAFFAQSFAAKRPQARAALLFHSVAAPRDGRWNGVPVQVHRYAEDHWIDPADVDALERAVTASGADFADVVVPGRGHLFTDLDGPDGDAAARDRSLTRVLELLA